MDILGLWVLEELEHLGAEASASLH